MKKTILILTLILFGFKSFGQFSNHFLFGIDLNSDWYTLTNFQKLTYYAIDSDTANNLPWVITDFNYSHNKISKSFMDIGYDELLLGFPRGMQDRLNELQPELFLSRKVYKDIEDYSNRSEIDIKKTIYLLKQEFGNPELNMIRDKFSTYEWKGTNYKIILTCRQDELNTTLIYIKE
jgi:hypothetical protein